MNGLINRRDFIKTIGAFLTLLVTFQFRKMFEFFGTGKKEKPGLKEAKYYSRADDLLG
ncbi:MAG: hypothetical protein ABIJ41_04205 [Candidatus Omnitrophota bacterium]